MSRFVIVFVSLLAIVISPLAGGVSSAAGQLHFFSLALTQQDAGGYTPSQIGTAYSVTPLTAQGIDGTGQTIALIELDKFSSSDIQAFDTANQLPAPNIRQFYISGTTFKLQGSPETTMDLEWAHALAPGAAVQIYYVKNTQADRAGWRTLAQAVNQAVSNSAGTISISFGVCGPSTGYKKLKTALARALRRGVSVFVSSGDFGALAGPRRDCGPRPAVAYPASDPSVTAVGGTTLQLDPNNTIADEVAWSGSGGGDGNPLPHPAWQVVAQLASQYRWAPDVAFVADPNTGVNVYFHGSWSVMGGTSVGAPAWAGIWSLLRQDAQQNGKTLGAASPMVYRVANSPVYSQAFNDITGGDNGYYRAGPGWDAVTGWGTPIVSVLATAVLTPSASGS